MTRGVKEGSSDCGRGGWFGVGVGDGDFHVDIGFLRGCHGIGVHSTTPFQGKE